MQPFPFCLLKTRDGGLAYDLSSLSRVTALGSNVPIPFAYTFTLCGPPAPPHQVSALCAAPSLAYQVSGGGQWASCMALSDAGASRSVSFSSSPLGVTLALPGGDAGTGCPAPRAATARVLCGEAAPATVEEDPPCVYALRVVHPAGCPQQCARGAAGVCGGPARGVCEAAPPPGAGARCACRAGYEGPACEGRGAAAATDPQEGRGVGEAPEGAPAPAPPLAAAAAALAALALVLLLRRRRRFSGQPTVTKNGAAAKPAG